MPFRSHASVGTRRKVKYTAFLVQLPPRQPVEYIKASLAFGSASPTPYLLCTVPLQCLTVLCSFSSQLTPIFHKMSSIPICLKCEKPVYAAEELLAGGQKWHKVCFKCNLCNKRLDSVNVNAHDNMLWCKQCYGRKFGPKGYGFGGKLLHFND